MLLLMHSWLVEEYFCVNRLGDGSNIQAGAQRRLPSTVLVPAGGWDLFDHVPHVVLYWDESLPASALSACAASRHCCSGTGSCSLGLSCLCALSSVLAPARTEKRLLCV